MTLRSENMDRLKGFVMAKRLEIYQSKNTSNSPPPAKKFSNNEGNQKHHRRKLEAIDIHAKQRAEERYGNVGFVINDKIKEELIRGFQGRSTRFVVLFSTRESNRRSDVAGVFDNQHKLRFIYDKDLKKIVTFLPLNDYEGFLDEHIAKNTQKSKPKT